MKLSNVDNEMPYFLKFNGTEMPDSEFYLLTNLSQIKNDQRLCGVSEDLRVLSNITFTKTISLKIPHRFWSYYVLKGSNFKSIKIGTDWYEEAKIKQNVTILTGYF